MLSDHPSPSDQGDDVNENLHYAYPPAHTLLFFFLKKKKKNKHKHTHAAQVDALLRNANLNI